MSDDDKKKIRENRLSGMQIKKTKGSQKHGALVLTFRNAYVQNVKENTNSHNSMYGIKTFAKASGCSRVLLLGCFKRHLAVSFTLFLTLYNSMQ